MIFLFDFCVSIATTTNLIDCGDEQVALVSLMGATLPRTKAKLQIFLENKQMCIVQIVNRIEGTQLGQSRTGAKEY